MIIMIRMMMMVIMIMIMMLMMMRRRKPSLWLKILSKLISPVFSRYLIITDLTIIKISFQLVIKPISILISQKKLYIRPTSRSDLAGRSFCSPEQLENSFFLHFFAQFYFVWSVCVWFTWRAFTFFHCHQIAHLKRLLLFPSFNLFAILIIRATLTDKIFITDVFLKSFLSSLRAESKNRIFWPKTKILGPKKGSHFLTLTMFWPRPEKVVQRKKVPLPK